jgi:hypothetical protein
MKTFCAYKVLGGETHTEILYDDITQQDRHQIPHLHIGHTPENKSVVSFTNARGQIWVNQLVSLFCIHGSNMVFGFLSSFMYAVLFV